MRVGCIATIALLFGCTLKANAPLTDDSDGAPIEDGAPTDAQLSTDSAVSIPCDSFLRLSDGFASLDTSVWGAFGPGTISVVGGQMVLDAGADVAFIESVERWSLVDAYVAIEVIDIPTGALFFGVTDVFPNSTINASFDVEQGMLRAVVLDVGAGINDYIDIESVAYDAQAHRFIRVRHAGSTVFFETSADGQSWAELASFQPQISVASLVANWGVYNGGGRAVVDTFNGGGSPMPQECGN